MDDDALGELLRRFANGEWPNVIVHSEPDWLMICVTVVGIAVTAWIAVLTLQANRRAGEAQTRASMAQVTATEAYAEALNRTHDASMAQVRAVREAIDLLNAGTAPREQADRESFNMHTLSPRDREPAPVSTVKWSLERDGKNRWLLRNNGIGTARHATIFGQTEADRMDLHIPNDGFQDVPPYEYLEFDIDRSSVSPPATIVVVQWADEFGQISAKRFVVI